MAIVEDSGGYSGVVVAAHELGHLLGAVHDGLPSPAYLGGPGADDHALDAEASLQGAPEPSRRCPGSAGEEIISMH